jgi:hypothetical protein
VIIGYAETVRLLAAWCELTRSSSSNRLPRSLRVLLAITTLFGSARPYKRAAKFGVSPTMPRSWASPEPTRSPTTTSPVAMPTRVCKGRASSLQIPNGGDQLQPRTHSPLSVILMGLWVTEVHEDPIAHDFATKPPKRCATMAGRSETSILLGIRPRPAFLPARLL